MQLKRNEMYKISLFVLLVDDMLTQEKIQKIIILFLGGGGGGGGGGWGKVQKFSN